MQLFFAWWNLYPVKIGFKPCKTLWQRLTEEQKKKAVEELPKQIQVWRAEGRANQFIMYPYKWLYDEHFEDQLEMPAPALTSPSNVLAFAKQRKIEALPGESMEAFTQRLRMTR